MGLTVTDVYDPDDCFANMGTKCAVATDGTPQQGELERVGDQDYFPAILVSGTEHQIDVKGNASIPSQNGGTLDDPRIAVYNPHVQPATVGEDNDSGFELNARLVITLTETGLYLIAVKAGLYAFLGAKGEDD